MTAAARCQALSTRCQALSNYALERSVKGLAVGAAGAWDSLAPAAPDECLARPAQRGR
jgi:hypothetical protein